MLPKVNQRGRDQVEIKSIYILYSSGPANILARFRFQKGKENRVLTTIQWA